MAYFMHPAGTGENFFQSAAAGHFSNILRKIADNKSGIYLNFALIWFLIASYQAKNRGFAGSIRTYQADFIAGSYEKTGVLKKNTISKGYFDVC
jgi:hypothetical protein